MRTDRSQHEAFHPHFLATTRFSIFFQSMPRLICTFFYLLPFAISAQETRDTLPFRDPLNYTIALEHYLQKIKTRLFALMKRA